MGGPRPREKTLTAQTDHRGAGANFFATGPLAEHCVRDAFALLHNGHVDKVLDAGGDVCLNMELCIRPEVWEEFLEVIR